MAVTFHEGFDGSNGATLTAANTGFASFVSAPVFSTAVKKAGTASTHFVTSGSASYALRSMAATTTRYWSFYVRPTVAPSANAILFFAGASSAGTDRRFQITLNVNMSIKVQQGSDAIIVGTATSSACPLNQWSRIDVSYDAGVVGCALFPGDANCDKAVGSAVAADKITGSIAGGSVSTVIIGAYNGTTADFYIDEFTEDGTAVPGGVAGGQATGLYLHYDTGTKWVDVTQNLWYDTGTAWVRIEGAGTGSGAVASPRSITGWGSSSMKGTGGGATTVLSELARLNQVATSTTAFSGDWSSHTAAKMGATPALVTLMGNSLPVSGSVAATISNVSDRGNDGTTLDGALNGTAVSIAFTKTGALWTATRSTPGSAVSVSANTPLVTNRGQQARTDTNILWMGKNDLTINANAAVQSVIDATQTCWDYVNSATPQRLVLGHFLNQDHVTGSSRTAIFAVNSAYASVYGQYYVDVEAFLSSSDVWVRAGVTPTAADLTAQANRVLPPSLASDLLHNNAAGYRAIAWLVDEHMRSLGWYA